MNRKQKDLAKKIAIITGIAIIAYFVLTNIRNAVTDRAAGNYSQGIAKDVVSKAKGLKRRK